MRAVLVLLVLTYFMEVNSQFNDGSSNGGNQNVTANGRNPKRRPKHGPSGRHNQFGIPRQPIGIDISDHENEDSEGMHGNRHSPKNQHGRRGPPNQRHRISSGENEDNHSPGRGQNGQNHGKQGNGQQEPPGSISSEDSQQMVYDDDYEQNNGEMKLANTNKRKRTKRMLVNQWGIGQGRLDPKHEPRLERNPKKVAHCREILEFIPRPQQIIDGITSVVDSLAGPVESVIGLVGGAFTSNTMTSNNKAANKAKKTEKLKQGAKKTKRKNNKSNEKLN